MISVAKYHKNPTNRVGIVQSRPHHNFIEN